MFYLKAIEYDYTWIFKKKSLASNIKLAQGGELQTSTQEVSSSILTGGNLLIFGIRFQR